MPLNSKNKYGSYIVSFVFEDDSGKRIKKDEKYDRVIPGSVVYINEFNFIENFNNYKTGEILLKSINKEKVLIEGDKESKIVFEYTRPIEDKVRTNLVIRYVYIMENGIEIDIKNPLIYNGLIYTNIYYELPKEYTEIESDGIKYTVDDNSKSGLMFGKDKYEPMIYKIYYKKINNKLVYEDFKVLIYNNKI